MTLINKVNATVLFMADENLDRCMKFYRDILGVEVVFSDDSSYAFKMEGQDFALVKLSSAVEMLNKEVLAQSEHVSHRIMLCADVEDVDAAYKTLTAKGLAFIKPPIDQPWGFRTAYFADPEGNIWEFRQTIPAQTIPAKK
ncbi:MAG TPA: VOC family protein [Phototrophicaceae bacterium]|jgi:uncharacterized glyoxalase superfamily protein PhnB|nr:VOC family protein [Phototrophicaceae bacterium]